MHQKLGSKAKDDMLKNELELMLARHELQNSRST